MNCPQALIHGDLHTGSIFANLTGIKVIDPEFAFYGPMGYDVGNVIGNLIFAWANKLCTGPEDTAFLKWIHQAVAEVFDRFRAALEQEYDRRVTLPLYRQEAFRKQYIDQIMADSLGYAGTELIRRTVGDSKVLEVTSVTDPETRKTLDMLLIDTGAALILKRKEAPHRRVRGQCLQKGGEAVWTLNGRTQGLAFLQRYENVAWYDSGTVRLLDRRVYPMKTEQVICHSGAGAVARAIRDMVTQSEGPYAAAAMGMALAASKLEGETDAETLRAELRNAAYTLSHARPTTSAQMEGIVGRSCGVLMDLIDQGTRGAALTEAAFRRAVDYLNGNYARYAKIGRLLAEQIPDGGTIMTQCFGGTVVGMILRACREQGRPSASSARRPGPTVRGRGSRPRWSATWALTSGSSPTTCPPGPCTNWASTSSPLPRT